jgi:hypothetical protein
VLVLLLAVLVLLAPTIASSMAPGIAAKQINAQIQGKADVAAASFSWTGGQVVGPVTISAPDGTPVAHVKISIDKGLTSLARAGLGWAKMDLGTVTISGDASVVRHTDGTTNLQQALAPRQVAAAAPSAPAKPPGPTPAGGETKLPSGLTATVVLDKLAVRYHDESRPAGSPTAYVDLPEISGKASIVDATKASLDLKTAMRYGAAANAVTTPGGTLTVAASADQLTDASGKVLPDRIKVDADVTAADVSLKAADALAGLNDRLTAALGDLMQAKVHAAGTMNDGSVTVKATSPQSQVDVALRAANGVITSERAGTIELNTSGLSAVVPTMVDSVKNGELALETYPRVKVTLDNVRIPSAALTGGAADLRGASARAVVETTEITGRVKVPEGVAGAKEGALQPFKVEPVRAEVNAADLAKGATIKAGTAMSLAGQSAGSVDVDLTVGDLLDAAGHRRAGLPRVQGKASVAGVSTAIAQPLVEQAGLDLPHGVGPKLDLTLTASTASAGAPAAASGLPPTSIDLQVQSQGVNADAALILDGRSIRSTDKGASVALNRVVALAGNAARKSGVEVTGDGYARATIKDLNVPIDSAGKIDAAAIAATIESTFGNMTIRPLATSVAAATPAAPPAPGTPAARPPAPTPAPAAPAAAPPGDGVVIQQYFANVTFKPDTTPRIDIKGSGSHQGNAFFTQAGLDLPGLREVVVAAASGGDAAGKAMQLRPLGQIELRNIPTSLATMTMSPPAPGGADLRNLIQAAVGPSVTVKLDATAKQGGEPTARDLALSIRSPRVQGDLAASVDSKSLEVKESPFTTTITPELAAAILDATGEKLERQPTLAAPAAIKLTVLPLTIPMSGLTPQLDKAGDAGVRVELPGPAVVQNVVLAGGQGQPPRDIGPIGVQGLLVNATAPLSSLAAGSAPKPAKADVAATLLGDGQQVIGTLKGGGQVALAGGAPNGPARGNISLELLNTPKIDAFLQQPGLVSGAVGDRIKIDADAQVDLAKATTPAAPGAPAPSALQSLNVNANIASPRLNTTQPFALVTKGDVATIDKPAVLQWNVDPAWANGFLPKPAPPAPGQPAPKPLLAMSGPTDVTVTLSALKFALGGTGGLLKPGVFAADAQVAAPAPKLLVSGVATNVKNVLVRAASGREPNVLGFSLRVDDLGAGPAPGGGPAVDFAGGLYGIADAQGNPTFGAAKLSGSGKAFAVPTAIIDAAAQQDGLLVDALGPTVNMTANASGVSMTGGQLSAEVTSERANAKLAGAINNGAFVAQGPVTANLTRITPEMGKRLTKGLPMVGTFEKTASEAPATVVANGLTVPLDGNLTKLNGAVRFDPGEAQFTTSGAFTQLLKITQQKQSGVVGRRLDPLNVSIKSGVATYDRYKIPLGDLTLDTQGTVDLVQRQLDVITYVPFGALTDQAAGILNSGLGKTLGGAIPTIEQASMVPIRTRGSFDHPETKPDLDQFVKEAGKSLRPDKIIGGTLQDLLKPKPKK